MNYIVSQQAIADIEAALLSSDAKDINRAREWIKQIRAICASEPSLLTPSVISQLWAQECPSIQNFAQALLLISREDLAGHDGLRR